VAVTDVDSVTLEIVNNRLEEIVQEMQYTIFRTGYSTIIRESKDTSACITSADGQVVGQAFQHPAHMGVFEQTIHGIYDNFDSEEIQDGDVFIANDPYVSGSPHPSDIVVARPVFVDGELLAFSLNVAHKPDIGGLVPGTATGEARELYHEGLLLPPVKWMDAGTKNDDVEEIIRQNSRIPDITVGDLRGQVGCTRIGEEKLLSVFDEYGTDTATECFDRLVQSTQTQLEERFADLEVTEAPLEDVFMRFYGGETESGDEAVSPFAKIGVALVSAYRTLISPLLPGTCRYRPTCSQYTLTALRRYGLLRGGWMGLKRILRCHPLYPGGYDPVP